MTKYEFFEIFLAAVPFAKIKKDLLDIIQPDWHLVKYHYQNLLNDELLHEDSNS